MSIPEQKVAILQWISNLEDQHTLAALLRMKDHHETGHTLRDVIREEVLAVIEDLGMANALEEVSQDDDEVSDDELSAFFDTQNRKSDEVSGA